MPTPELNDEENITFSGTASLREEPSTKLDKVWEFFANGKKPNIETDITADKGTSPLLFRNRRLAVG